MTIGQQTISNLLKALETARDELKRVNDHYSCVRPDPMGVVLDAINSVSYLSQIPNGSETEKLIVGKLVTDILNNGLLISVMDGEEVTVRRSRDAKAIFAAIASTDEDFLYIYRPDDPKRSGWVRLIWGNDAHIISDYTDNAVTTACVSGAEKLAEDLGA